LGFLPPSSARGFSRPATHPKTKSPQSLLLSRGSELQLCHTATKNKHSPKSFSSTGSPRSVPGGVISTAPDDSALLSRHSERSLRSDESLFPHVGSALPQRRRHAFCARRFLEGATEVSPYAGSSERMVGSSLDPPPATRCKNVSIARLCLSLFHAFSPACLASSARRLAS
jgi:hypothetical protein